MSVTSERETGRHQELQRYAGALPETLRAPGSSSRIKSKLSHGTQGPTWSMLLLYPTPSAWPLSLFLGSHSIWNPRYIIVYLQVAHMHMALWPLAFLTSCSFCLEHYSLPRMAAWASFPLGSPMGLPSSSHSTEKVACPCGVLLWQPVRNLILNTCLCLIRRLTMNLRAGLYLLHTIVFPGSGMVPAIQWVPWNWVLNEQMCPMLPSKLMESVS